LGEPIKITCTLYHSVMFSVSFV